MEGMAYCKCCDCVRRARSACCEPVEAARMQDWWVFFAQEIEKKREKEDARNQTVGVQHIRRLGGDRPGLAPVD